jgi:hypothetical protein
MISVPTVHPGDMVFWQCDVVHAVEKEHTRKRRFVRHVHSCPQNTEYVQRQAALFGKGCPPPDFPQGRTEREYNLSATERDLVNPLGRAAMGLVA